MSNHFPAVPTGLAIQNIQYTINMEMQGQNAASLSPLYFDSDSTVAPQSGQPYSYEVLVTFPAPGTYGTFDQDIVEAHIADRATSMCQSWATEFGVSLASMQSQVTIIRSWNFSSVSVPQFEGGYEETMAYP